MPNQNKGFKAENPISTKDLNLPHRVNYYSSPIDWRNEIIYFAMIDRFSDGNEEKRKIINRNNLKDSRPDWFRWDEWSKSGSDRWQGGTLKGIQSKLPYLENLGVTAIWCSPIFKQRHHSNEYHGYGVQNFLEIDPHFGTKQDLIELVSAAHLRGIRIILDIIINHSGHNWDYKKLPHQDPPYVPWPQHYEKGFWLNAEGQLTDDIKSSETGVLPVELQNDECYTRAGVGSLNDDNKDVTNPHEEFKRTDFPGGLFRDFNLEDKNTLNFLMECYKYWMALADIDGFRIDTLKHIPMEAARNFCGGIKEYAASLGKYYFLLIGEIPGDNQADIYLETLELNLDAALDIGNSRIELVDVAKGKDSPQSYFDIVKQWEPRLGSHRYSGPRHVLISTDHDCVYGKKERFTDEPKFDHQVVVPTAIQLFTLGIPCIYYGEEQGLSAPELEERKYLSEFSSSDRYLRETMFGALHPRKSGADGLKSGFSGEDNDIPGFAAFGAVGYHCFNDKSPSYIRIKYLIDIRKKYNTLSYGRQYLRQLRNFDEPFNYPDKGELIVWSRILDEEEILCIANPNLLECRGGDVIVDSILNSKKDSFFQVIANTVEVESKNHKSTHPVKEKLQVKYENGNAYIEIRNIEPSEVILLSNFGIYSNN